MITLSLPKGDKRTLTILSLSKRYGQLSSPFSSSLRPERRHIPLSLPSTWMRSASQAFCSMTECTSLRCLAGPYASVLLARYGWFVASRAVTNLTSLRAVNTKARLCACVLTSAYFLA